MISPEKMRKMPSRLSLQAWLELQINSGEYKGLKWLDRGKLQFVVPWKHASRHGWLQEDDAALFKAWAVYTKRHVEKRGDRPRPKVWKANFRCAVNACPDIKPVKGLGSKRGKNAYRVFQFSKIRKSKRTVTERNPGRPLPEMGPVKIKEEMIDEDEERETNIPSPCKHDHKHNTRSNKRSISREENIKQEYEDAEYPQHKRPKIEDDSSSSQCIQLPKMPQLQATQPQLPKTTETKKLPKKTTEDYIKEIKTENDNWHQWTIKDMIQSIPQLPRPGELGSMYPSFYNSMQPHQNSYSYGGRMPNYTQQYNFPIPSGQSNVTQQDSNETIQKDMMSLMFQYAKELLYENDGHNEDLNSGSDEESIIGSRRPGSVASSLTDEELEAMLLDTDPDCYPDEFEKYGDIASEQNVDPMDTLNFISTQTDPFLSGDMQAISEAMRTDYSCTSF